MREATPWRIAVRGVGLLTALVVGPACAEGPLFVPSPPGDPERTWFATKEKRHELFRLQAVALGAGPIELPPETAVFALEWNGEIELPRDRPLSRADFQTASCDVMRPDRVWAVDLIEPAGWVTTETPEVLSKILSSLARNECHRCVRFAEEPIELPEDATRLEAMVTLASGAKLVSTAGMGLIRVDPDGEARFLTGCEFGPNWLAPTEVANEVYAVFGPDLLRLGIDESNLVCTELTRDTGPAGAVFIHVDPSPPGEPLEIFLLAQVGEAGGSGEPVRAGYRYTERGFEHLLQFQMPIEVEADLVRLGPGEALYATGQERVIHWRQGSTTELVVARGREIPGIVKLESGEVLAFDISLAVEATVHRYDPETRTFEALGLIGGRAMSAATFREGFISVTRTGDVIERSNGSICPVSTSFGNRRNHTPRLIRTLERDTVIVDLTPATLSRLRPLPPDPPSELEF